MPRAQSRGPQTLPMAGRQKGQPPLGANAETYKQHVHPGSVGAGWGWQLGSAVGGGMAKLMWVGTHWVREQSTGRMGKQTSEGKGVLRGRIHTWTADATREASHARVNRAGYLKSARCQYTASAEGIASHKRQPCTSPVCAASAVNMSFAVNSPNQRTHLTHLKLI